MVRYCCLVLAAFLVVVGVQVTQAEMVLRLNATGLGAPIIIADNQASGHITASGLTTNLGDTDPTSGVIAPFDPSSFPSGAPVGVFTVDTATVAFSTPGNLLDGVFPYIDTFLVVTSNAVGTFIAELTGTDFTLPDAPSWLITGNIGGFTDMPLTIQAAIDNANQEFGVSSSTTSGVLGPGPFNTSLSLEVATSNPFSLSQTMTLTADTGGLGATVFDYQLTATPNPEPTSLLLWGVVSGVGLCVVRYRRSRGKRLDTPATEVC